MKRREFLVKGAAGLAGGAALAACGPGGEGDAKQGAPGVATQKVVWRLASSFPRGLDTIFGATEVLADTLDRMSSGRFKIRVYPGGELVPGLQVLDAVQQGTVQVGQTAGYYYTGKNPAFAFDTAVPFGLNARQQVAWINEAGGRELLAPIFADFNIVAFWGGSTGTQMGGWFRKEIQSPEDMQGLKIRIPGPGGEVMNRKGATVQVLAGGDIYPALERGAIDATEWIGPYDDEKLGFHKVAPYYYTPGWWEGGPALSYYVNRQAWEALPTEFQAMFQVASQASGLTMLSRYDSLNPAALARLRAFGTQLRRYPDAVMARAREISESILADYAAADPAYRKVYDAWIKFRSESFDWFNTAEQAYAEFAFRP